MESPIPMLSENVPSTVSEDTSGHSSTLLATNIDAFHLFPRLPIELRLLIWEASFTPRIHRHAVFTKNRRLGNFNSSTAASLHAPVTLQVNHEARQFTLRQYKRLHHRVLGPSHRPFFFNPKIDILQALDGKGLSNFSNFRKNWISLAVTYLQCAERIMLDWNFTPLFLLTLHSCLSTMDGKKLAPKLRSICIVLEVMPHGPVESACLHRYEAVPQDDPEVLRLLEVQTNDPCDINYLCGSLGVEYQFVQESENLKLDDKGSCRTCAEQACGPHACNGDRQDVAKAATSGQTSTSVQSTQA